jgi:hypothetical protein
MPVTVATPDLPVVWWVFWLVVMAIGVFVALIWWLTQAALREDAASRSSHDAPQPEGHRVERETDA